MKAQLILEPKTSFGQVLAGELLTVESHRDQLLGAITSLRDAVVGYESDDVLDEAKELADEAIATVEGDQGRAALEAVLIEVQSPPALDPSWRPSKEGLAQFAAEIESKRRAALFPELLAVLDQAQALMPLGTNKRAEWNVQASLLILKAKGLR